MANLIGTIVYTDSIRQEYWVRWPPCTGASKVQGHLLERIGILDELALEAESDA